METFFCGFSSQTFAKPIANSFAIKTYVVKHKFIIKKASQILTNI